MICLTFFFFSHILSLTSTDLVNQLCKQSFLRQLYRKADGATLLSQNERNLDCEITFQTLSILQKFMLRWVGNDMSAQMYEILPYHDSFHSARFDTLSLDCNDHLFVFDGGHAAGPPKVCLLDDDNFLFVSSNVISHHLLASNLFLAHQMDISCRNTKQSVGVIITNTNHVTLKYVTDNWGTDSNGFKLVVSVAVSYEMFERLNFNWIITCLRTDNRY